MTSISLNFIEEETFITDYKIKNIFEKDAQIIVKTLSGNYYTAPYTIEDLDAIRHRMKQEKFDIENLENKLMMNYFKKGVNISVGCFLLAAGFQLLSISYNLVAAASIIFGASKTIQGICQCMYNKIKINRAKKKTPNLDEHKIYILDSYMESKRCEEKVNILFKRKNFMPRVISSTIEDKTYFWPEELEELEYTVLTEISESEANWYSIPYYGNDYSHAKRKKRTKKVVNTTERNKKFYEEAMNIYFDKMEKKEAEKTEETGLECSSDITSTDLDPEVNTGFTRKLKP